jgi:Tol biopolymer transport system component
MKRTPLLNLVSTLLAMMICLAPTMPASAQPNDLPDGSIQRVSVAADGTQGNASVSSAGRLRVSADGHYVVFSSSASNLVPGDNNGKLDVFLVNRVSHTIERISMGLGSAEADGNSLSTDMTPDGRYIVFYSNATNLVAADSNGVGDVFVYDQTNHTTTRVSVSTTGAQGDANSAEGHISYDGSQVVFASLANGFASETGGYDYDVFVHDRDTDHDGIFDETGSVRTFRITIGADGSEPDSYNNLRVNISGNGRYVSFGSDSKNLVSPPDADSFFDVFVFDRDANNNGIFDEQVVGGTHLAKVSVDPEGNDGDATSYLDESAPMSEDGRYITFPSAASNLVEEDYNGKIDIFVRDLQTGQTTLITHGPGGVSAEGKSYEPYISSDGRYIAFQTAADGLVSGDDNGWNDCLIHDMLTDTKIMASRTQEGSLGNGNSGPCYLSATGQVVVFMSDATNLVPNDTNHFTDVFIYIRMSNHSFLPQVMK